MVLSFEDCLQAAHDVMDALDAIGETWSCLVGGMAARLYGVDRHVKDLDITVLRPDADEVTIQNSLIEYDPQGFYLQRPRDRNASFFKLMYRIPQTTHVIKVDLLLSTEPELEIPNSLHRNHFSYVDGLALAPLYFILYHKLLGWEDRANSSKKWKREQAHSKDYQDVLAISHLLRGDGVYPLSKAHMGRQYLDEFRMRAENFAECYEGEARTRLSAIGFDV